MSVNDLNLDNKFRISQYEINTHDIRRPSTNDINLVKGLISKDNEEAILRRKILFNFSSIGVAAVDKVEKIENEKIYIAIPYAPFFVDRKGEQVFCAFRIEYNSKEYIFIFVNCHLRDGVKEPFRITLRDYIEVENLSREEMFRFFDKFKDVKNETIADLEDLSIELANELPSVAFDTVWCSYSYLA